MTKGPPPSDNSKRTELRGGVRNIPAGTRAAKVPPLPGAKKYTQQTRDWYAVWASSPQASEFSATEWQRLHFVAAIVDLYWLNPSQQLMSEIRQNEAKLGATLEDRVRLRMRIMPPSDEPDEKPAAPPRPDPRKK